MVQHTHHYYINASLYDTMSIPQEIQKWIKVTQCQKITNVEIAAEKHLHFPEHAQVHEWKIPLWAARSSLFSIIEKKYLNTDALFRKIPQELHLKEMPCIHLQTWGCALNMYDRLVWMECLAQLQTAPTGQPLKIKWRSTLKSLGQSCGINPLLSLKHSLHRLSHCAIIYAKENETGGQISCLYITQLLEYNEADQTITLPATLLLLLHQQHAQRNKEGTEHKDPTRLHHLAINKKEHLALKTGLGRWLHGWYSSHETWWPITYEMIVAKTSLQITETRNQTKALQRAVDDLNQLENFGEFELSTEKGQKLIQGMKPKVMTLGSRNRQSDDVREQKQAK